MTYLDERNARERKDTVKRIAVMCSLSIAFAAIPVGLCFYLWLGTAAGVAATAICFGACFADILVLRKSQLFKRD
jgi:hypothetical protein